MNRTDGKDVFIVLLVGLSIVSAFACHRGGYEQGQKDLAALVYSRVPEAREYANNNLNPNKITATLEWLEKEAAEAGECQLPYGGDAVFTGAGGVFVDGVSNGSLFVQPGVLGKYPHVPKPVNLAEVRRLLEERKGGVS